MQVASMFKPWTVTLAADPGSLTLGAAPLSGAFNATLDAQDIAWPATLVGCVKSLSGVDLTAAYKDTPVTWTKPIGIPGWRRLLLPTRRWATTKRRTTPMRPSRGRRRRNVPCSFPRESRHYRHRFAHRCFEDARFAVAAHHQQASAKLQNFLQPYEQPAVDAAKTAIGNFKSPHASATAQLTELVSDPLCTHTPPPGARRSRRSRPCSMENCRWRRAMRS